MNSRDTFYMTYIIRANNTFNILLKINCSEQDTK